MFFNGFNLSFLIFLKFKIITKHLFHDLQLLGHTTIHVKSMQDKFHNPSFVQICGTQILNVCPCCNSQTPNIDLT